MARAFAGEGAAIWVTDIDADALAGCPADWQATRVDAADPEGMAMLYEAVTTRWGGLDVLCANAGIAPGPRRASRTSPWRNGAVASGSISTAPSWRPRARRG